MENEYVFEILSISKPPIKLGFLETLECPYCEYSFDMNSEIDLQTFQVDNDTIIYCDNCNTRIKFLIKELET